MKRTQPWRGFRLCEKCRERLPYPDSFARTKRGKVSHYCLACYGHPAPSRRRCDTCGRKRRIGSEIKRNGHKCLLCQKEAKAIRARERYASDPALRERIKARVKRWSDANPEKHREYERAFYSRMMADPERRADERVRRRMTDRTRQGLAQAPRSDAVEGWTPIPAGASHFGTQLDAGPLAEWLRYEFRDWPISTVARYVGVDESELGRIIRGDYRRVSEYIADRIFVGADCPHLLSVLYPEGAAA